MPQTKPYFHIRDQRGLDLYWCCSKKHGWHRNELSASRCCNGWTAVRVPAYYDYGGPDYWGRWYEPVYIGSYKIVIPDFLTDEIARLRAVWGGQDMLKRTVWDWEQSNIEIAH